MGSSCRCLRVPSLVAFALFLLYRYNLRESHYGGQNYALSYTVRDHKTGDDFSHSQHSSGSATNGEYRVRLPDGRMQIVSYTADENGYKDDDKTSGNSIDYGVNRNFNNDYNRNQNYLSGNVNYNGNQNYNNYKDTKNYNVKIINDVVGNARDDTKPVVEPA